jgi:hypothetical protein
MLLDVQLHEDVDDDVMLLSILNPFTTMNYSSESFENGNADAEDLLNALVEDEYTPSTYDVICSPGKEARAHPGTKRFRKILVGYVERYSKTTSKLEKSLLISEIVKYVQERGNFIKISADEGGYCLCSEAIAREKVGQGLRDLLHKNYRSSCKNKQRNRNRICHDIDNYISNLMEPSHFISQHMKKLQYDLDNMKTYIDKDAQDEEVLRLFTQTNVQILEALKKDSASQKAILDIQAQSS